MSEQNQIRQGYPNPAHAAAVEGRTFCGISNDLTGIAAEAVITTAGFLTEIPEGKRLVITCFYMYLSTTSDWATAEWVVTGNADGSGVVTVLAPKFRMDTGTPASAFTPSLTYLSTPLVVDQTDGLAFTAQVQGNDADAALTLGYYGYYETIHP